MTTKNRKELIIDLNNEEFSCRSIKVVANAHFSNPSIFKRHMKTRSSRVNNAHETRLKHVDYARNTRLKHVEYA
jgi:hypothetical protein